MEKTIYNPPTSEIVARQVKREQLGKILSLIGCILQSALVFGIIIFIVDMVIAFQETTLYGSGDPKVMAGMVSSALISVVLGCVVAFPGLLMNITALLISSYSATWLFRFLITSSIFWILVFPIGTLLGVVLLVVALKKRKIYIKSLTNIRTS
ncbi:MotA/TolQ/ExbB proton channel family protein [Aliikangiella sp. G2MR2-5]|uniref:MotA/TolQ/ExbB proton channel family protein n=1 Tax=Aliikangiella sp. G2MR2-5 TaxID=2788943 RepID=UPI0018AA735E|nr:MotA/TolQ/ExbB proton channel family protein [Aliikangiella sp. G2MR2-5]